MKKIALIISCFVLVSTINSQTKANLPVPKTPPVAANKKPAAPALAKPGTPPLAKQGFVLKTAMDSLSYAIGIQIFNHLIANV